MTAVARDLASNAKLSFTILARHVQTLEGQFGLNEFDAEAGLGALPDPTQFLLLGALQRVLYEQAAWAVAAAASLAAETPGLTLGTWVTRFPEQAKTIPEEVLGRAYGLYQIRNKLVAHHDEPRLLGTGWRRDHGYRPLFIGTQSPTDADVAFVRKAWRQAGLPPSWLDNIYDLLRILLDRIPVFVNGAFNPDRTQLGQVVERAGLKCHTTAELQAIVGDLLAALEKLGPSDLRR